MPDENLLWLEKTTPGTKPAELAFLALEDTFVSGDTSNHRLNIRYYQCDDDGSLLGKVIFGPGTQGPPDHAHGGSMAALLDEAMGGAAWLAGHPVVAAQLNISFRTMLPLGTRCLVKARVLEVDRRKIKTTAELCSAEDGQLFCKGEALFITLDLKQINMLSKKGQVIVNHLKNVDKS